MLTKQTNENMLTKKDEGERHQKEIKKKRQGEEVI